MTKEEAIKTIESAKRFAYDGIYDEAFDMAISALSENKRFDGMTNGEVIQALFPNANYDSGRLYMHIINVNTVGEMVIPWRWWNAPYKEGGNE